MKKLRILLASVLLLCGCTGPAAVQESTPSPTPEPTPAPVPTPEVCSLDLFMVGDCLVHDAVFNDALQEDGTYDFTDMFTEVPSLLEGYDLRYYNQEAILGGEELGYSGYPMFNCPSAVGDALTDMGFNLVSLANNHSLDRGEQGIINSMEYWKAKKDTVTAGTNLSREERDEIPVYEKNGISYAFLSWTYGTNGLVTPEGKEYLVNVYPDHEEEMLNQVRRAKEKADLVLIAMHWGVEYTLQETEEQQRLAQELADAGADIIIGCHPHVVEPITWLNDGKTLCIYSLGNFISAQIDEEKRVEMAAGVTVTKTVDNGKTTVVVSDPRAQLLYDSYDGNYRNFHVVDLQTTDDPFLQSLNEKYLPVVKEEMPDIQIGVRMKN
ncbi:MAG: CapA family protein [Bulleidia sp.]|nr:CapA family protein [Bulleidia sp.]